MLGAPRGTVLSDEDRKRVAYHEGGHAIVGMLTPGADPVRKVSIIPRGMALGVTLSAPDLDKANYEEAYLLAKIKVALGGRVAEEIVYGTITTGAESDIEQLTGIARAMVGRWGMSRSIGPIAVLPSEMNGPLLPGASEVSPETQRLIDQEVQRIVEESHQQVTALLTEHRDKLESLVEAPAARRDARPGRRLCGRAGRPARGAARHGRAGRLGERRLSPPRARAERRCPRARAARGRRRAARRPRSGSRATSGWARSRAGARPWRC